MKPFVGYRMSIVSLVACIAAVTAILDPPDFALRGFAWVTLTAAAVALSVMWVAGRSPRSLSRVLDDVDHEPALAADPSPSPRALERK